MRKTFTLADANRMLPLVSRIVRDLVGRFPAWRELVDRYEVMTAGHRADTVDLRAQQLEREVNSLAREIDGYIRELTDLGVEVRNPLNSGLVDFPGFLDGRPICLCWRLGEEVIDHWHEVDAGFAGRRPIDTLAFADR